MAPQALLIGINILLVAHFLFLARDILPWAHNGWLAHPLSSLSTGLPSIDAEPLLGPRPPLHPGSPATAADIDAVLSQWHYPPGASMLALLTNHDMPHHPSQWLVRLPGAAASVFVGRVVWLLLFVFVYWL